MQKNLLLGFLFLHILNSHNPWELGWENLKISTVLPTVKATNSRHSSGSISLSVAQSGGLKHEAGSLQVTVFMLENFGLTLSLYTSLCVQSHKAKGVLKEFLACRSACEIATFTRFLILGKRLSVSREPGCRQDMCSKAVKGKCLFQWSFLFLLLLC